MESLLLCVKRNTCNRSRTLATATGITSIGACKFLLPRVERWPQTGSSSGSGITGNPQRPQEDSKGCTQDVGHVSQRKKPYNIHSPLPAQVQSRSDITIEDSDG